MEDAGAPHSLGWRAGQASEPQGGVLSGSGAATGKAGLPLMSLLLSQGPGTSGHKTHKMTMAWQTVLADMALGLFMIVCCGIWAAFWSRLPRVVLFSRSGRGGRVRMRR